MLRSIQVFMAFVVCCLVHAGQAEVIAIDVGHSIVTPGSISATGITEFVFNQRLALSISQNLKAIGINHHLINLDGRIPSLRDRTAQAVADSVFVSIHHDSVQPQFLPVTSDHYRGFSIWLSRKNVDFLHSKSCAIAVADSLIRSGFSPSNFHADPVSGEGRQVIDLNRGIFLNDDLIVLKSARSPAVLIEAGVIVHPVEERFLLDPRVINAQAQAIATGLSGCHPESSAGS